MTGNALLATLFSKGKHELARNLTELLKSYGFSAFTIWDVDNNTICKSVASTEGLNGAIFDIYDLGYDGSPVYAQPAQPSTVGVLELHHFDNIYPVYASVFCSESSICTMAITFHSYVDKEQLQHLQEIAPYIASRVNTLDAGQRQLEIFVDYQKKIDFIKESGQILKSLSLHDVIVNAINFFSDAFHAEAACVTDKGGFVMGLGLTEADLEQSVFVNDAPLSEYLKSHTDTLYITEGVHSEKFNIINMFLVQDTTSGTIFIMFNISGDVIPDKELSALITHLVSVAIENAHFHERETALKVEQSEMQQSVEIINKFVPREMPFTGYPSGYSVNYPAKSTGGDYSTIIDSADYTFICLADVCGKGYAAATLTIMLASIIDSEFSFINNIAQPTGSVAQPAGSIAQPAGSIIGKLVNHINSYIIEKDFSDRFITGFVCFFDKKTMKLKYVSCGHEPVYVIRAADSAATAPIIIELTSKNLPMGIVDEEYEVKEFDIARGDVMFIYSDGVIEYIDYEGLKGALVSTIDMPAKDMLEKLYADLVLDPQQQRDDFTCTVVRF